MLANNPYVIVIALDFTKAFDTVRHSTMLHKMDQLNIPDNVYEWFVDYFSGHMHSTKYDGAESTLKPINASVIQGSAVGPASYAVTASDLKVTCGMNKLVKFADDRPTYIVIPASCSDTRSAEIDGVELWARANNLLLNRAKSKEVIFVDTRRKRKAPEPSPLPGVARVTTLKILGVTLTTTLSASDHVRDVIRSSAQTLYALRVLRAHGMPDDALQLVFHSVIVGRLLYASCAWNGFISTADRRRVDAFLRRSKRSGFCSSDMPTFDDLLGQADTRLFRKIVANDQHVLHQLLPPQTTASQNYSLRERPHQFQLPERSGRLSDSNFINRMLYTDIY